MTDLTRRGLLRAGVSVGVLVPIATPLASSAATMSARMTAARLYRRSRFTPMRRASFQISNGKRRWSMRLAGIADLSPTKPGSDRSFSLTFRCAGPGPGQGSYTFQRRGFAATTLFIVPSDRHRRTYQVVVDGAR